LIAGNYEYFGIFDQFQPKGYSIAAKRNDNEANSMKTPGPGAYNPTK
jgi:hypothetical protein